MREAGIEDLTCSLIRQYVLNTHFNRNQSIRSTYYLLLLLPTTANHTKLLQKEILQRRLSLPPLNELFFPDISMPTEYVCQVPTNDWQKSEQDEKVPAKKRSRSSGGVLDGDKAGDWGGVRQIENAVKPANEIGFATNNNYVPPLQSSNLSDVTSDDFGELNNKGRVNALLDTIHKQKNQHSMKADAKFQKCFDVIDKAQSEERIDAKKANRLRHCLNSKDAVMMLLCEQIPTKRPGRGYKCRICQVAVKGHICPYCPICSTTQNKVEKHDDHICINCTKCFEEGKKKKKLIQVNRTGHICPHSAPNKQSDGSDDRSE